MTLYEARMRCRYCGTRMFHKLRTDEVVAGNYKVEMQGARNEFGRRQVGFLPRERREVLLPLQLRYPAHYTLAPKQ